MCDTWVALRDATLTKNVIFGKNSDRPIFDCQPLLLYPRQEWPAHSAVKLEYLEIPQAQVTYATLGSSPYWCWGYEEGLNEYGVVIGNEALPTKTFRQAASAHAQGRAQTPGILGMDLIRLALERSRSAAQAVDLMGRLTEQYGQFGSAMPAKAHTEGGYDNSFIVADPGEAWILETIGRRWAAKRIATGCAAISNEPAIGPKWDAGSPDLKKYAIDQGWWPADKEDCFNFARAYIDDKLPRQVSHIRVMRSRQLLAEKEGEITAGWMKRIARDHYEGTFLQGPYFDAADPDFHSICMHVSPAGFTWGNTASSCVAVLPKNQDEFPIFWWTPGPPCNGCYVPFFVHGSKLPPIVSTAGACGKRVTPPPETEQDKFSPDSYWWLFRALLDKVKGDPIQSLLDYYANRNRIVRAKFDALEQEFEAALPDLLQQAAQAKKAGAQQATSIFDQFTEQCVGQVTATLNELLDEFA